MKSLFFVVACLLPMAALADDLVADADGGVKTNVEERVIDLPQDQGKWFVSIFGDPNDPQFQKLRRWFQTHEGLLHLRSQVHWNIYTTDSPSYQRYIQTLPGAPCVRVQTHQGVVASEFWAEHLPLTPSGLYRGIREDLADKAGWGCLRRRRCPQPEPAPQPTPEPVPEPEPVIPDLGQPPELPETPAQPASSLPPLWLLIVSGLAGAGAGGVQAWRGIYNPEDQKDS